MMKGGFGRRFSYMKSYNHGFNNVGQI